VASPSVKSVNLVQMPGKVVNESEVLIKGPFYKALPTIVNH
jgi:hypothetical protein